jgi:cell division protein FtsL
MQNRTILSILVVIIIVVSAYMLYTAYEARQRSNEILQKFKQLDDSLKKLNNHPLQKDSAGMGATSRPAN